TLVDSFLRRSRRLPVSTLFPYTTLFRSSLAIAGNLPTGVTVSYANNGQVNAGEYTVTATIDGGRNYEDQALTAELTIKKATLTGIIFQDAAYTYDGTEKSDAIRST